MGRRSVWSDTRLHAAAEHFVSVADEVYRLQSGTDAECLAFQEMANLGHYRGAGGTRQGIYVCTPAGVLLASINSNSADKVLAMIERGLSRWDDLSDAERAGLDPERVRPARRHEDDYPVGGLVLRSVNRDLAPAGDTGEVTSAVGTRWNRDHAWFSAAEARSFLPAEPRAGEQHEVPLALRTRLARYHLVDNVRGQAVPFAKSEVEDVQLTVTVDAITGSKVQATLRGSVTSNAPGPWQMGDDIFKPGGSASYPHGIQLELFGTAEFDLELERFASFELVARGERWGRTQNNGRAKQTERGPLGFVFSLAPAGPAGRVPPAFAQVYDAPWMDTPYSQ